MTKIHPNELDKYKRLVIIGEQGSGKSVMLRDIVLKQLAFNTRDNKPLLPLLVKATDLSAALESSFIEAVNQSIKETYQQEEFDLNSLGQAKLTLLIDGLDEIVDTKNRERLIREIIVFGEKYPERSIILTSRSNHTIVQDNILPDFARAYIQPFNLNQVTNFIQKWFGHNQESIRRLLAAFEDHDLLSRLPNTPLVLTLLAILFESDDLREIPANLAELYKMFIDLLLGRWALDRRVNSMYDANIREYIVTLIACRLHYYGNTSLSEREFNEIVENCEKSIGYPLDSNILLNDFVEQTAILILNDRNELEFRHLSFQEFLVGKQILQSGSTNDTRFLVEQIGDIWWSQVTYFYCGLRQQNRDILQDIITKIENEASQQHIHTIWELGYLIQSSYLTDIELRMDIINRAFRQFFKLINPIDSINLKKQVLPSGLVFSILTFLLSMHYSSRLLKQQYAKKSTVFLENEIALNEEDSFLLLMYSILLTYSGETNQLQQTFGKIQAYPKQVFVLGQVGEFFNNRDSDTSKDIRDLKKKIRKFFRKRPDLWHNLTDTEQSTTQQLSDG